MSLESGNKKKPESVRRAQLHGDTEALRAMGRKGAEKTKQIKADKHEMERYYKEQALRDAITEWEQTRKAANEHIVPIDPEEEDSAE